MDIGSKFTKSFDVNYWFMADNTPTVGKINAAIWNKNCPQGKTEPYYIITGGKPFTSEGTGEQLVGNWANYEVPVDKVFDSEAELLESLTTQTA